MYHTIRHITGFSYSSAICQSVMEIRMQPLTDGGQRCVAFKLATDPHARVFNYHDYLGNIVHHFDIPEPHTQLTITAESVVSTSPAPALPDALEYQAWSNLDAMAAAGDHSDMLSPSAFVRPSELLSELALDLRVGRNHDPLTTLRELSSRINAAFEYCPQSTSVDSPIEEALLDRQGVCQDFSHIMIALARGLGIPCRYVSGYLYHRLEDEDRSAADATHAWVEALLPNLGWIGLDPTNNAFAGERHVRVAIGRDYADVPLTRGFFQGITESTLEVAVQVVPFDPPPPDESIPDQTAIKAGWCTQQ